ncbi:MAG: hypothetical protein AAB870_04260 [Patescibacteria group bacterium]
MPIISKIEKLAEDGIEKDAFVVSFTNGAKDQITDLKEFFEQKSEQELIELGISLLQRLKEQGGQQNQR